MEINNNEQYKIGDWVKLHSSKGEQIHGYIEKMPENKNLIQLRVVESDNEWLSGHSIQVETKKIKLEKNEIAYSIGELEQLIDLALSTKDEAWFDSLVLKYKLLNAKKKTGNKSLSSNK